MKQHSPKKRKKSISFKAWVIARWLPGMTQAHLKWSGSYYCSHSHKSASKKIVAAKNASKKTALVKKTALAKKKTIPETPSHSNGPIEINSAGSDNSDVEMSDSPEKELGKCLLSVN